MKVWIWDTSGRSAAACGVTASMNRAQAAAASRLASGQATTARVEEVAIVLGTGTLTYDYQPTGHAWQGQLSAGHVSWSPVTRSPQQSAS